MEKNILDKYKQYISKYKQKAGISDKSRQTALLRRRTKKMIQGANK